MTADELAELERLAAEATPGPWRMSMSGCGANATTGQVEFFVENAAFIAASRSAVPKLIAMVRERDAEIARMREAVAERVMRELERCQHAESDAATLRSAIEFFFAPGPGGAVPVRHDPDLGEPHNITWNRKLDRLRDAIDSKAGAALLAAAREAAEALEACIDDVEDALPYVDGYYRSKWNLGGSVQPACTALAKLRAALGGGS